MIIHDRPWGQRLWRMAYATSRDREGAVDGVCCLGAPADRSLTVAAPFGRSSGHKCGCPAGNRVLLIVFGWTGKLQRLAQPKGPETRMSITTRRAFTIVELLVVVTIIVLLVSLLVPALSKAVYQAQLVKCATNYRFLAGGSQNYALDYKKRYPFRDLPLTPDAAPWPAGAPGIQAHKLTHAGQTGTGVANYDLRPMLRPYVKIDDVFNDPLCIPLNYDNREATAATTSIYTSVFYWAGWYFVKDAVPMPGILKLGDRFKAYDEFDRNKRIVSLGVLAGDIDCAGGGTAWSSHPDFGAMTNRVAENAAWIESNWTKDGADRLPLDLNYAYDDGSVRRVDRVVYYSRWNTLNNDERMVRIANFNTHSGSAPPGQPTSQQANNVPLN